MKHNVQKPVWIPYPLVPFFSVWEEASEDVYIHRHISNSDAIVPYDEHFYGHDRVWHVSPATPQHNWLTLGSLTCRVVTEILVLHSAIF